MQKVRQFPLADSSRSVQNGETVILSSGGIAAAGNSVVIPLVSPTDIEEQRDDLFVL